MNKLAYHEPHTSLNNRIAAHAKFSNFDLHQWIDSRFDIKEGDSIFDVGCGNGNYVEMFLNKIKEKGIVQGVDKNEELINEANSKYGDLYSNVYFNVGDYDSISNINKSFDWIFSIYSLYYTSDSRALINKLKGTLSSSGKLIVIGPASNNATDLDDFNFKVTGVLPNIEHKLRTERIESEFLPLFEAMFGKDNTKLELIDSVMSFPSVNEFSTYYWSTLLWRDSVANFDSDYVAKLKRKTLKILSSYDDYVVKKQMSCLVGINS
jgi:ubiquinone/menaquinone biosynthesis C-methylase UbiE